MSANPQWMRRTLCEDLAEIDRKSGRIPDTRLIEQVVDGDLERWEGEQRSAKHLYPVQPEQADYKASANLAELRNAKATKTRDIRFENKGAFPDEVRRKACQCGGTCMACKLRHRILALMASKPLAERVDVGPEMHRNCVYPAFAREILNAWKWMTFARSAAVLKKKGDLDAVMTRKLEDIADRSTALIGLGPWR